MIKYLYCKDLHRLPAKSITCGRRIGSALDGRAHLTAGDGALDHLLVDRDDGLAAIGGIELDVADNAPEGLAERPRPEAVLPRGVPGGGDERAARDLEVDAEAQEVG